MKAGARCNRSCDPIAARSSRRLGDGDDGIKFGRPFKYLKRCRVMLSECSRRRGLDKCSVGTPNTIL